MKNARKLTSILVLIAMLFMIAAPAMATEVEVTGDDKGLLSNHTFTAYQIFTGDEHEGVLSNVQWGNGINYESFLADLKADETYKDLFADCEEAADVAKVLGENNTNDAMAKAVAKIALKHIYNAEGNDQGIALPGDNLAKGYYLIVDTTNVGTDEVKNAALLQVIGEKVTVAVKTDQPTLDKQIKHNEENNGEGSWGKVGDNQIGDTVEFRTITTVPDTTYYDTYTYKITDTMSAGLTSNVKLATDIEIKVNDSGDKLSTDYYSVAVDGNSFTLTIDIKKAIKEDKMVAGDSLYTYYSGVLNKDALIYDVGKQQNEAQLEYSNEPDGKGTGKTEKPIVYDWTFKMGVNKIAEDPESGYDSTKDPDGDGVDTDGHSKYKNLDGAKFVLSKDPNLSIESMNLNADGIPTATDKLIALIPNADKTYTVAPEGTQETTWVIDAGETTIKGLDDATDYYLYEIKAPAGYNLLGAPVQFKISAAYNEAGDTLLADNPTVTVGPGAPSTLLSTDIENKSGSTLPSTGGIGTTIFYVVGAALVVGAGVLLVTKKRMTGQR